MKKHLKHSPQMLFLNCSFGSIFLTQRGYIKKQARQNQVIPDSIGLYIIDLNVWEFY